MGKIIRGKKGDSMGCFLVDGMEHHTSTPEKVKNRHKMATTKTIQFESNPTLPWTQNSLGIRYSFLKKNKSLDSKNLGEEFVSTPPLGQTQIATSTN